MNVIALLSGGKDSVAAIEVAQNWGWNVVAAIKMVPAEDDAYMFHTPNLHVVDSIAHRLGIPLRSFPSRMDPEEEVDDLQGAIAATGKEFQANGIISGALRSEYQRTRIERIGYNLNLKSFTPIWHKESKGYMQHIVRAYDIRFARTAAEGVPNAWAGTRVTQEKIDQMAQHSARPDICGEGGEYETLVLNAPHYTAPIEVEGDVHETASRATWVVMKTR